MNAIQNVTTSLNETVTTDPRGDWSQQETIEVTGVGKMSSTIQNVTTLVTDTLTTDPRDWSQQQMIVLSVIGAFVVLILLLTCYCCRRRKKQSRGSGSSNAKDKEAEIMSPHVIRAQGSFVSVSKLPKGALLHGAEKLSAAKLDGRGVRVAVIDSGIDKDHTGFNGMVRKQKWYLGGKPLAEDDHGTHVAGTIHFMAPQAELYDYRVFGKRTFGGMTTSQAIVEAIQQAVKDGCHVINMSLSVPYPHPSIHSAVKAAAKKGVVMVCAAGNSGDGDSTTNEMNTYPARFKETISCAAVKKVNGLPVAKFSESNPEVDFAGIGVDVQSFKPGGGFQKMSGTSMATPHLAGFIAALMTDGSLKNNPEKVRKELASKFAIDIGEKKGRDNSTGVGFVTFLSRTEFHQFFQKQ